MFNKLIIISAFNGLHLIFSSCIKVASDDSKGEQMMDKIANDTLAFWKVPGCAVAVVQGDKVLLCEGYGVKQIGLNNAIDCHTRFPIASITKLITAAAFGILHDQGTITLDNAIMDVYPTIKLSDPYAASHLTFRDCLAMRSGLPGPSVNHLLYDKPAITREELLDQVLPSLPLTFGFRSHFAYQNLLYLLAEIAFKPSYRAFLQQHLLAPLEMNETLTSFQALQNCPNKVFPNVWNTDHFEQVPFENLDVWSAAAGLSSSAHDMTHFLSFLLHQGTYRSKTLLSLPTFTQLFTPQVIATNEEFTGRSIGGKLLFPNAQFLTYGLGCFIHDYRGIGIVQVPGQIDGINCVLAIVPSLNLGFFVGANAESAPFTRALLFQLLDTFLDQKTDWNQYFLEIINL